MGGVPSREATTIYSYFRGTYEIGLIPLTKAFFGSPCKADDDSPSGMTAAAHRESTEELRRQFVLMRSDPAIVYANMRKKMSVSWSDLLSNGFTENDLDAFLEEVEETLYNTDAEMVADSQRPLIPVPCALCLACKDGQERSGCFSWNGRSIVIIGYFGCMTNHLCTAFKVKKGKHSVNATAPGSGVCRSAFNGDSSNSSSTSSLYEETTKVQLFLNAAVLSSAGDRTLERVLVLAAVMLRNQYLDSVFHALHPMERSLSNSTGFLNISGSVLEGPPFSVIDTPSTDCMSSSNNASTQHLREEVLRVLENRLRYLIINVETAADNYSSLKSLTENVAFLQCQTTVNPNLCDLHLPRVLLDGTCCASTREVDCRDREETETSHPEDYTSPNSSGDITAPTMTTATAPAAKITEKNENQMISANKRDGDTSYAASHDEIPMPLSKEERATNANGVSESEDISLVSGQNGSRPHSFFDENASLELVCLRFMPGYVTQAIMWASSLLTSPTRLANGKWVQYKLKDESDELRQTLHGRDSIVAAWREECKDISSAYMGDSTLTLLRHVRFLQKEVERARSIPVGSWASEDLMQTREGRTCALHRTSFGTMLVGIRSRREGTDVRRQDQKKHLLRETNARASDVNASSYHTFPHDPRSFTGTRCFNPCQANNVAAGSTSGITSVDAGHTSSSFSRCRGLGGTFPPPMCGVGPSGFMTSLPFAPPMQPSSNLSTLGNFGPGAVMFPYLLSAAGDTSNMERKRQTESLSTSVPPPLYQPISAASVSNALANVSGSKGSDNNLGSSLLSSSLSTTAATSASASAPPNTRMQVPPYPYMLGNTSTASPGGAILTAGPVPAAQQQFVLVPQGSGGVPVLMPFATSTPQQSSFMPLYGYNPYGTGGNPQVAMSSSTTQTSAPSWALPQQVCGSASGVAVTGNGQMPNYVYYLPTQ